MQHYPAEVPLGLLPTLQLNLSQHRLQEQMALLGKAPPLLQPSPLGSAARQSFLGFHRMQPSFSINQDHYTQLFMEMFQILIQGCFPCPTPLLLQIRNLSGQLTTQDSAPFPYWLPPSWRSSLLQVFRVFNSLRQSVHLNFAKMDLLFHFFIFI